MRWLWRGVALVVLLIGWIFIAWKNHFHISAPLVVVCLAYLAVIVTVMNLWRTGAAAVAEPEDGDDSTWAKPAGALGELEREKRTLLKAIKEAEFDHQMGKLSQVDVDAMIRTYRARAIEVMKEIERLASGGTGTTRDQIMREVRARVELETKAKKPEGKAAKARQGDKKAIKVEPAPNGAAAVTEMTEMTEPRDAAAAVAEAKLEAAEARAELASNNAAEAARRAHEDEVLDADSTTAIERKHDEPAKEATP